MSERVSEIFDQYVQDYEQALQLGLSVTGHGREYFAAGRITYLARLLGQHGARQPVGSVLDFGCGVGTSAPLLRAAFSPERLMGVDPSVESIKAARAAFASLGASFTALAEYQPPGDFDLCYTNGVFHHIAPDDRPAAARVVFASLAPGGYFAFFENNPWNPGTRYVMSRIPFDRQAKTLTPGAARALLRNVGFEVVATRYLFVFPAWLRVLQPIEPLLDRAPLGAQYLVLARRPLG